MKVIVTGSRDWNDYELIEDDLDRLFAWNSSLLVIEGGAVGADAIAGKWARLKAHETRSIGAVVWRPMPALWSMYGPKAGPLRNEAMLATFLNEPGEGFVLAYPHSGSRGTRHMMDIAARAGVMVLDRSTGAWF